MLDLDQIVSFYPVNLRAFRKNILREYLQHKVLEIIYSSRFSQKLNFMGGTALRIIYGHNRFSEDLDFDNLGLSEIEFNNLSDRVRKKLSLEGYSAETRVVFKAAFSCHVKIGRVLFETGLSGYEKEKMLIKIDAEPQAYKYHPDKVLINRFDIFFRIHVVPLQVLLSQKIAAILTRKRTMGRDFYDAVFLFGRVQPDEAYLKKKLSIRSGAEIKEKLLSKCTSLNLKRLAKDVEPFLLNPEDSKKVLYFQEYVRDIPMR